MTPLPKRSSSIRVLQMLHPFSSASKPVPAAAKPAAAAIITPPTVLAKAKAASPPVDNDLPLAAAAVAPIPVVRSSVRAAADKEAPRRSVVFWQRPERSNSVIFWDEAQHGGGAC